MYKKPLQPRAIASEERLLNALDQLLREKCFGQLTIDEIAGRACLTRGAFLKRFGSKKQALFVLWRRYCDRASAVMAGIIQELPGWSNALEACVVISSSLERIQLDEFSANRAMYEDFQENLRIDPATKKIFLECVDLMRKVQGRFLPEHSFTDVGAFAAAQLLVSINYNYVLKAMPALPQDSGARHQLIGEIISLALRR